MKYIALVILIVASGCSTPNPNPSPKATAAAYEQVKLGMSRQQVYALLGQPESVQPSGDFDHCRTATWGVPHDSHDSGHWAVGFSGDTVSEINTVAAHGFNFSF